MRSGPLGSSDGPQVQIGGAQPPRVILRGGGLTDGGCGGGIRDLLDGAAADFPRTGGVGPPLRPVMRPSAGVASSETAAAVPAGHLSPSPAAPDTSPCFPCRLTRRS